MTNEQKQHFLVYLGYYRIKVDGIWGNYSAGVRRSPMGCGIHVDTCKMKNR